MIRLILFLLLFSIGCSNPEPSAEKKYATSSVSSFKKELIQERQTTIPEEIRSIDSEGRIDSLIGAWEGDWYMGDRIELVIINGFFYRRNVYTDGRVVSHPLEIRDANGVRSYINIDESSLEYYRIEKNGNLGRYSKWLKVEEIDKLDNTKK